MPRRSALRATLLRGCRARSDVGGIQEPTVGTAFTCPVEASRLPPVRPKGWPAMTMRKKSSSAGGRRASRTPARAPGAGRSRPGRESIAQSLAADVTDQRAAPGRMTPLGADVELPALDVHL